MIVIYFFWISQRIASVRLYSESIAKNDGRCLFSNIGLLTVTVSLLKCLNKKKKNYASVSILFYRHNGVWFQQFLSQTFFKYCIRLGPVRFIRCTHRVRSWKTNLKCIVKFIATKYTFTDWVLIFRNGDPFFLIFWFVLHLKSIYVTLRSWVSLYLCLWRMFYGTK